MPALGQNNNKKQQKHAYSLWIMLKLWFGIRSVSKFTKRLELVAVEEIKTWFSTQHVTFFHRNLKIGSCRRVQDQFGPARAPAEPGLSFTVSCNCQRKPNISELSNRLFVSYRIIYYLTNSFFFMYS